MERWLWEKCVYGKWSPHASVNRHFLSRWKCSFVEVHREAQLAHFCESQSFLRHGDDVFRYWFVGKNFPAKLLLIKGEFFVWVDPGTLNWLVQFQIRLTFSDVPPFYLMLIETRKLEHGVALRENRNWQLVRIYNDWTQTAPRNNAFPLILIEIS